MDYPSLASTVLSMLTTYGCSMTIVKEASGAFNPATGKKDPSTIVQVPCLGVIDQYDAFMVNGTSVLSDDQRFYIAASGVAQPPVAGDKITMGAATWNVVNVNTVGPAAIPLYYDVQVRQ
jgi:hypothetical protein